MSDITYVGDTIYRQAAIEAFSNMIVDVSCVGDEKLSETLQWVCERTKNACCEFINKLPSAQPERFEALLCETKSSWTLVSDELPDKQTTVIVSCIDNSGDTPFSYTACGYWVGLLPDDDPAWIVDGEVNYHVIAWMLLPEPYRKG